VILIILYIISSIEYLLSAKSRKIARWFHKIEKSTRKFESVRSREGNAVRTWHSLFFSRPSSRSGSKMAEWWGPELVLRHSHQSFSGPSRVCVSLVQDRVRVAEQKKGREKERERGTRRSEGRFAPIFLSPFLHFYISSFSRPHLSRKNRKVRIDRSIDWSKKGRSCPFLPWEKRRFLTESAHCAPLRAPG